jgi:hypothetical protein
VRVAGNAISNTRTNSRVRTRRSAIVLVDVKLESRVSKYSVAIPLRYDRGVGSIAFHKIVRSCGILGCRRASAEHLSDQGPKMRGAP